MNVKELLQELVALYPRALGSQETMEHWARFYRAQLGSSEGPNLRTAFDTCMAKWTAQTFPKPADIAKHLPRPDVTKTEPKSGWSWAHQIMSGDWGKKAVRAGVASDLDIWLQRNPGEYPDAMLLEKFERDKAISAAAMRENQSPSLQALYQAMQGREAMLARKYGLDIDDPLNALAAG